MIRSIINNPYSLTAIRFYFRWIYRALCIVPRLAAATAEALLRRNFGARYIPTLAAGWALLLLYAAVSGANAPLLSLFMLLVGVQTVRHAVGALRDRGAHRRHSRSAGEPVQIWAPVTRSPAIPQCIGESGLCLAAGMGAALIDPALSLWLATAAGGLIIKDATARLHLLRRTSDAIDARIEAEQFGDAVNRRVRSPGARREQVHRARIARTTPSGRLPRP